MDAEAPLLRKHLRGVEKEDVVLFLVLARRSHDHGTESDVRYGDAGQDQEGVSLSDSADVHLVSPGQENLKRSAIDNIENICIARLISKRV